MSYKQMTGNIISATKVEPVGTSEVGAASGVWNLDDQYDYKRGANWPEAGVPGPDTLIENNFSTFLYTGNDGTQTINNGIDLAGKGGLVWLKPRDLGLSNRLMDSARGPTNYLVSDTTDEQQGGAPLSFGSSGFSLTGGGASWNQNTNKYVSWTFKKAPKFFDIVTYEGNGSAGRTLSHSLGLVPGMIMIKNLDATENWMVYHRKMNGGTNPEQYVINLNLTSAQQDDDQFHDTAPTSTVFTLGSNAEVNADGENYVAYLFAHETGADSMIQCGSYTGNGNNTGPVINLGWEPQWLLIRNTDRADDWVLIDSMRGIPTSGDGPAVLRPESAAVEYAPGSTFSQASRVDLTGVGFDVKSGNSRVNGSNQNMIYMAIRRPNMATITDATEVFKTISETDTLIDDNVVDFSLTPDFHIVRRTSSTMNIISTFRLTGGKYNFLSTTAAEAAADESFNKAQTTIEYTATAASASGTYVHSAWKRAKGYFDVVAYTGTGSALNASHGLGVAPEMMWIKNRDVTDAWAVYYGDNTDYLVLNTDAATVDDATYWNDTSPTSSVFTVNTNHSVNADDENYIAMLFATLAGISKIGTISHTNGTPTDVNCGFTSGARFVIAKRYNTTGTWHLYDTVTGIVDGNELVTSIEDGSSGTVDRIDPLASGFQLAAGMASGSYLFYAVA